MDNSNLIITGYQSMIGEEEQHNLSGSPVIMSVCGSFQETFPNLELNIDNLNCNQEPLYNDGLNNEYQYKSSYGQLFTKTNGNNNAPISSCIIPIDAVNRLISSSSQHTFNSKQLDISNENEIYPGSLWILNNPRQAKYKEHLPAKFHKKLEYLAQENRRLFAKCKTLMTSKRILLDTETKYLQLKNKVLETEEILLEKGLNTSELSVFRLAKDTIEIPKDVEHQVLLECKLAEVNNQLYNNSASQSTRLFTEIEPPTDNGNSMSEIHNLVTK
ncbi:Hypothetical protein CINCED_3A017167 [Cinara cedri]|nr:Hypothetical protein CINCED_3A017167 [Cinara cedri]